mmetsp:Transcript_22593/g.40564  ORF Transcript_22593/g.40564 Transcript_22593/m.40564 type:complete len:92 (+) Transcript_22593:192-467(+)
MHRTNHSMLSITSLHKSIQDYNTFNGIVSSQMHTTHGEGVYHTGLILKVMKEGIVGSTSQPHLTNLTTLWITLRKTVCMHACIQYERGGCR